MRITNGTRLLFRAPVVVGPIVAAVVLIADVRPGYAASAVYATFENAGAIVSGKWILTLSIPEGKYAIFAKINIDQDDTKHPVSVVCTLEAGADRDLNVSRLQWSKEKSLNRLDNAVLAFQAVQEFRTEWVDPVPPDPPLHDVTLSCRMTDGKSSLLSFRFAKLMAIKLDGVLCTERNRATCP